MKGGRIDASTKESVESFKLTLDDILVFATGASSIPPTGFFPSPEIQFHSTSPLPVANTCGVTLHLPLGTQEYEVFKYNMCLGITNAVGFGQV